MSNPQFAAGRKIAGIPDFAEWRNVERQVIASYPTHGDDCLCEQFAEMGRANVRMLITNGSIPTEDLKGWTDAVSYIAHLLSQMAGDDLTFFPAAVQHGAMAVLLEDMQRTEFDS